MKRSNGRSPRFSPTVNTRPSCSPTATTDDPTPRLLIATSNGTTYCTAGDAPAAVNRVCRVIAEASVW